MYRLLLLFLFASGSILAQPGISRDEAHEDAEVAIAALEECHPGLNNHLSEKEVQQIFSQWRSLTKEQLELPSLHKTLLQGIARIGDGHTDLLEGERYRKELPDQGKIMPFRYRILNDRVFISEVLTKVDSIAVWSEILSINQHATSVILKSIYDLTPADGGNVGFKRAYNEKIFGRQFAKYFGASEDYSLVLKSPDGIEKSITVKAVHDSVVHFDGDQGAPLKFEIDRGGNYAVLTVNTFQYQLMRKAGMDYHEFLKSSFRKLKMEKIENLIIDLRENYGGDNILGLTLYSFLAQSDFKWMEPSVTKLLGENSTAQYSSHPKGSFRFLETHEIEDLGNGTHRVFNGIDSKETYNSDMIFKGPGAKPENIAKYKFDGDVYLLTSGLTFSAGAIFSAKMATEKRAIIVGEETGGAHSEFCGGGFYRVTLPNSKFVLQIPFMRRKVSGAQQPESGIGTVPDVSVSPTIESLISGEDVVLKAALNLISGKNDR